MWSRQHHNAAMPTRDAYTAPSGGRPKRVRAAASNGEYGAHVHSADYERGWERGADMDHGTDRDEGYTVYERDGTNNRGNFRLDDDAGEDAPRSSPRCIASPSPAPSAPASTPPPPPPPPPSPSVVECAALCGTAPSILATLQEVTATLPVPAAYGGAVPAGTCADACAWLGATGLAAAVVTPSLELCNQGAPEVEPTPGYALAPSTLYTQAVASVQAGLGSVAAATIQDALAQTQGAVMTPAQALAADALVGSLRVRNAADGWTRVSTGQPCLAFPRDHGLHLNMADEWYFVVGVLTARGAGETTDTYISFCWMLDWRLVAPAPAADPLSGYLVDAQFAVAEAGAPNSAMHAALWGAATPLTAQARPLVLAAGGMSLAETPGAAADGLNGLQLAAANPRAGTMLSAALVRDPATAPIALELGTGIVGDLANGNGNLYYSAPFLAVQPGGAVVSLNAAGLATARTVTGGIAWFDHQMGCLGRPTTWGTGALWSILAAAAPRALPVVDRGFSVSGQENWWGLMFTAGALAGAAFMGTVLALTPAATLAGATVNGNWIVPDGKGGATVTQVTGTASATAAIKSANGSAFASAFSLTLPRPPALGGGSVTVTTSNLAADGFMQWSKGDTYSEAAQVVTASDGSVGMGWAEQVGWDTGSTTALLKTLNVANPSTAAWTTAPASFAAGGYWFLVGAALLGLLLLVFLGWGVTAGVKTLRARGAKTRHVQAQVQAQAHAKPSIPTMTVPVPRPVSEPVPVPPHTFAGEPPLLGGATMGAVDALVSRWLN